MNVSIIVPAYNAEYKIKKCINSILSQTYRDFEVIIVNDGSTDATSEICKKMAKEDNRVVCINQKNSGAASARNTGIKMARGDFLQFVDADDELPKDSLMTLYMEAKNTGSDLVVGGFEQIDDQNKSIILPPNCQIESCATYDQNENIAKMLLSNSLLNVLWNKLYRKKKMTNYIPTNIRVGEDLFFNLDYLRNDCKISCIDKVVYRYYLEKKSITKMYSDDYIENLKKVRTKRNEFCKDFNIQGDMESIFWSDIHNLLCLISKDESASYILKKERIISVLSDHEVQDCLKTRHVNRDFDKNNILALLAKKKMYSICYWIYLLNAKRRKSK